MSWSVHHVSHVIPASSHTGGYIYTEVYVVEDTGWGVLCGVLCRVLCGVLI